MAVLLTPPYLQFFDADGNPLAGGFVHTYQAGTVDTPKAAFTDSTGNTEIDNPVELDDAGRPLLGGGSIWISGSYKIVVKDSLGNTIETTDNVTSFTTLASAAPSYFQSFSGTGSQTAFTLSQDLGTDENSIMVFVDKGIAQQFVTNGSFATDTGWTKGAGWTIAAGVATATGAISTAISQTAALTLIPGQAYAVIFTITRSAGGLIPSLGGQNGTERTASGTYREVIICGATQTTAFTGNGFTGTLDDVSITLADPAGFDVQNPNLYTLNGTTLTFATAPPTGTVNILVFSPSSLVGAASAAAAAAAVSEANAATSAATALAAAYFGTSSTSIAIGTGSKSFTTQTGKNFQVGGFLLISSSANGANYMHGQVTSYNILTGALVMNIIDIGGSGTHTDWLIYVSGTQGTSSNNYKIGSFTRDTSLATGSQSITGIGFVPKSLTFFGAINVTGASCEGMATSLNSGVKYSNSDGSTAGYWAVNTSNCLTFQTGVGAAYSAVLSSMDSDGFTLGWTKTGSTSGTAAISYLAIG